MKLLAFLLRVIFGYRVQRCDFCGRHDNICWWAPPSLWETIVGDPVGGIRCIPCFHREAEARGITLRWVPRIDATRNSDGGWDVVAPDPELFPVAARYADEEAAR